LWDDQKSRLIELHLAQHFGCGQAIGQSFCNLHVTLKQHIQHHTCIYIYPLVTGT